MIPLSAWGRVDSDGIFRLVGRVFSPDGDRVAEAESEGNIGNPESLGAIVAQRLLDLGAGDLLRTNPTVG